MHHTNYISKCSTAHKSLYTDPLDKKAVLLSFDENKHMRLFKTHNGI